MKKLKISSDEIIKHLQLNYKIKNLKFMMKGGYEKDREYIEMFDYIEGEVLE